MYNMIRLAVYILSVVLSMVGLSAFRFDEFIRKGHLREFYLFYIISSLSLGYLLASFILNFVLYSLN